MRLGLIEYDKTLNAAKISVENFVDNEVVVDEFIHDQDMDDETLSELLMNGNANKQVRFDIYTIGIYDIEEFTMRYHGSLPAHIIEVDITKDGYIQFEFSNGAIQFKSHNLILSIEERPIEADNETNA